MDAMSMEPGETRSGAEHKTRQRNNFAALAAVAILLIVGAWLMDRMLTARRTQNCIEAGHRNCVPLDLPPR